MNSSNSNNEWRKTMSTLMQNVALNQIIHSDDSGIFLKLLSTYDGRPIKEIRCHKVWRICLESDIENEDRVSRFITDIMVLNLTGELIQEVFEFFSYGFLSPPNSKEYYLLSLLGNEINIDILCGGIEVTDI